MYYPSYIRRNDPFALMRSMMRDVDRFIPNRTAQSVFPAVNVWQGDDAIAITAELPGVDAADIDISVKNNVLTLSGERKVPTLPEGAKWHRSERGYGKFTRSIKLPFAATEDKVEARMADGVLHVVIGRPEEDKPKKIEIKAV